MPRLGQATQARNQDDSRGRLGIPERVVERLRRSRHALHDAPAIIVGAESDGRFVVNVTGVERGSDFVQGNPSPCEIHVGHVALLADAGNADQFPSCDRDRERRLASFFRRDENANRIDAGRRKQDVPARRSQAGPASGVGGGDPAMMLQYQVFGRKVILVGNDAGLQEIVLGLFEGIGGGDQVRGETPGQKVARGAGEESKAQECTESEDESFSHQAHLRATGLRRADSRGRRSPHNLFNVCSHVTSATSDCK